MVCCWFVLKYARKLIIFMKLRLFKLYILGMILMLFRECMENATKFEMLTCFLCVKRQCERFYVHCH